MEGRVLVTGFGAFGSHMTNISEEIARLLDYEVVRNHRIESLILSVDEPGSKKVSELIKNIVIQHICLIKSKKNLTFCFYMEYKLLYFNVFALFFIGHVEV